MELIRNIIIIFLTLNSVTSELIHLTSGNFTKDIPLKSWSSLKKLLNLKAEYLYQDEKYQNEVAKKNMETTKIIAAVENKMPYIQLLRDNKNRLIIRGFVGRIWSILQDIIKFKVTYINDTDESALHEGLADMSLTPIPMKSELFDRFDCSHSLGEIWYYLYSKSDCRCSLFSSIWKYHSKYATIILLMVSGFFQWTLLHLRVLFGIDIPYHRDRRFTLKKKKNSRVVHDISFMNSYLNVYGLVLCQGTQIKPNCNSSRILSLMLMIFGSLLSTSYSAILISKITISEPSASFGTLDELSASLKYSLCVSENSYAYKHFKIKGTEQLHRKWELIVNRPSCTVTDEHMVPPRDYCRVGNVVLENPYNVNYLTKVVHMIPCVITTNDKKKYFQSHLSFSFRKGFPHQEIFNRYLIRIKTSGILSYLMKSMHPFKESDETRILIHAVSFQQIENIFILYLQTIGLSIFIFIIEILYYHRKKIIHASSFNMKIDRPKTQ